MVAVLSSSALWNRLCMVIPRVDSVLVSLCVRVFVAVRAGMCSLVVPGWELCALLMKSITHSVVLLKSLL